MCIFRKRFTLKNWLLWSWRLASLKSAEWTGRLEDQGRVHAVVQVRRLARLKTQERVDIQGQFPVPQKKSIFCFIQAFNWFNEAHPHYREQSASFKVHWFKYLSYYPEYDPSTPRIMLAHISGHHGPATLHRKLTITLS